jgi:hypothetical protein
MRAAKGIYRDGVVTLASPGELKESQEVTVLIPDEGDDAAIFDVMRFAGLLGDLSDEEKAAFEEALERPVR